MKIPALNYFYLFRKLRERYQDKNIVGFGFGCAEKDDYLDEDRPRSIQVFVKQKLRNTKSTRKIPKTISIPLPNFGWDDSKRSPSRKHVQLKFPTDVIVDQECTSCGGKVKKDGTELVTTGAVVRWKVRKNTGIQTRFGVLTVAHAFFNNPATGISDITVKFPSGIEIVGSRLVQTVPRQEATTNATPSVDACLIEVSDLSLLDSQIISSVSQPRLPYFATDQLLDRPFRSGVAENAIERVNFSFLGIRDTQHIRGIGFVDAVVRVVADDNDFIRGTSGTIFQLLNEVGQVQHFPAAMQLGSISPEFSVGLGQSLHLATRIIRNRLDAAISNNLRRLESFELIAIF